MTSIGRRDTLVSIERLTPTVDQYGEEAEGWAPYASEWAAVFYGRGDERRQAAMEQGQQAATFNVLANEKTRAIKLTDRIVTDGPPWDISGIAPDTPIAGEVEITATRAL